MTEEEFTKGMDAVWKNIPEGMTFEEYRGILYEAMERFKKPLWEKIQSLEQQLIFAGHDLEQERRNSDALREHMMKKIVELEVELRMIQGERSAQKLARLAEINEAFNQG